MLRRFAPFAADLVQHRGLIWQFTLRNVELRHKGSYLGLIWAFANPLLLLALYVLVFGFIFGGSFGRPGETRVDYGLGIFLGLTIYHFVAETLSLAPSLIVSNPNFVKKVVFPLEVLPAAGIGAALVHLLIGLGLVIAGTLLFGRGVSLSALWIPLILLPLALWALGLTWLTAALGVFFRDIGQLVQFGCLALMFASAVFYPISKIPPAFWEVMKFNPVLLAIELARDSLLWQQPIRATHLGYLYGSGAIACYVGHWAFRRLKPAFADVI